jgi:small subunit ribosomal protein S30e
MPTHGSLTKAGKVRNQTPRIESTKRKKTSGPRMNNHQKYGRMLSDRGNFNRRGRRRRRRRR